MTKRKPKPTLPPVRVVILEGPASPAQGAAWAALWQRLLGDAKGEAPGPGQEGRGSETEVGDGEFNPPGTQ